MILAEVGLPPGADVDRASLGKLLDSWTISRYELQPDRIIVRARNRYAHGLYETKPFTNERLLVLSIKVAALLYCSEDLRHEGATAAIRRISQNSPYKNEMLSRSDKP
jgi:signal transduction histidine kinase